MLVNVEMLNVWNLDELEIEIREELVRSEFESGVYKIDIGSRGMVEDIEKIDIVDGKFEVMSEEEICKSIVESGGELVVYEDGVVEFVSSYLIEKGLEVNKNMWYEGWYDEVSYIYVRVEV